MGKIEYVRCPRCELNYIDKREKMCKVCEAEMQAKGNKELTDEEIKELNLCPVCRTNYLVDDEEMCAECAAEKAALENSETMMVSSDDEQGDEKDEREDNWRAYVENDDAEVPEDEYGDMTSITSADDEDTLDDDDLSDIDKDDEFDEEFDDEFSEEEPDDFDESFSDDFEDDFEDDFDEDYEDDEDDDEDNDDEE